MDRDRVSSDLISSQARAADRNPCRYLCSGSEVGSVKEQHLHDREDFCPSLQPRHKSCIQRCAIWARWLDLELPPDCMQGLGRSASLEV